ncbi:PQQ-binding-like beta-propeller repeat protein [Gimesia panareensis]|nr:PQQ-binding-like beta-propeller repeat protein [Gimesia panareensis]
MTSATCVKAGNWPMWRYDAGHTASTPDSLPDQLTPVWTRKFGPRKQVWDDTLNNDLMTYDKVFEPVVYGKRMFVGFNDADKLVALDTRTGKTLWTFFTEGPVRFSPVATEDRVYLVSDDGYLYCLNSSDGTLVWKFRGAPAAQKALGNQRVISAWPARGGPVLYGDQIYFAASIWPFMGTFIYALDAETGDVVWVNDSTSASYIKQPHSAPSFAGVAPQGTLVATEDLLLVPGGRSVPAALDRKTGEMKYFHLGGKGNGGSFVISGEKEFYVHTRYKGVRAYSLETGLPTLYVHNEPVLHDGQLYSASVKNKQPVLEAFNQQHQALWSLPVDGQGDLIRAGNRIYAAGEASISAVNLPANAEEKPTLAWHQPVTGTVARLLAADNKLFAVTQEGAIMAFGVPGERQSPSSAEKTTAPPAVDPAALKTVKSLLQQTEARTGYAICVGGDEPDVIDALLEVSGLRLLVLEPDTSQVAALRKRYDARGEYGVRVSVHQSTPESFQAPQHIARVTMISPAQAQSLTADTLQQIYRSVRPYGGVVWIPAAVEQVQLLQEKIREAELPKAEISVGSAGILIRRVGALPDSADWTHQYGDIANSVKSNDKRVKLPLGVLWFGGNSHEDVLPRHGHGPPEQVIGGRTFLEGMNSLSARDVYTGEVLWRREFEDLGTFGIYFNSTYADTPLSTQYNQKHIPGANARGTNYIATTEEVYLAMGPECHVLNAADGKTKQVIKLPDPKNDWAFIAVDQDILLAGNGFAHYGKRVQEKPGKDGPAATDLSASGGLIAFDRHTGEKLWQVDAVHSFLHNGIVAGRNRLYCLDKLPAGAEKKLSRRGMADPSKYRIICLDLQTGKELWSTREHIFGSWLGYSEKHDLLLEAGARASDRLSDEVGQGMIAYRAEDGSVLWQKKDQKYTGPLVLHNDLIITSANSYQVSGGAFHIRDGSPYTITNPITREEEPLKFSRTYGCNYVIASENLLTFRSGAAGFYDLATKSGTGNFGGFKSSCTSNLVVANGVLNAPDYTRTCSCSYQNQTSLALIHMPEIEVWTNSQLSDAAESTGIVKQAGINFGAPGDRKSDSGTLWLDYPSVGGESPDLEVKIANKQYRTFRRHALKIRDSNSSPGLSWVAASGIEDPQKITIAIHQQTSADSTGGIPVASVDDDAEEAPQGKVSMNSSDLELGLDGNDPQVVAIRFTDIPLSRADELEAAFIQFTVDETGKKDCRLKIQGELAADSKPLADTKQNLSSRKRTHAVVEWVPPAWTKVDAAGEAQRTPDLKPILDEIRQQPGWKPGNQLTFLITGTGTRTARSYRGASSGSARLILKKKETQTENRSETVTAKENQNARRYKVRLTFTEPNRKLKPGDRKFDVLLQGERVLQDFDILAETGQPMQSLIKEFPGIKVTDQLVLEFNSAAGSNTAPLISGIELISEN